MRTSWNGVFGNFTNFFHEKDYQNDFWNEIFEKYQKLARKHGFLERTEYSIKKKWSNMTRNVSKKEFPARSERKLKSQNFFEVLWLHIRKLQAQI